MLSKAIQKVTHLFWLFFLIAINAFAQKSDVFRHLNTVNGLSHNRITCIIQDKIGFIWIGTEDGLNRYNGYKIDVYKHNPSDETSVSSNGIRCLFEDHNGKLWIGTDDGLSFFDIETEHFGSFRTNTKGNAISSNQITCMEEDASGVLWVGTAGGGINLLNTSTGKWQNFTANKAIPNSICSNNITAIVKDKNGVMYIGTDNGLAIADRNQTGNFTIINHDPANTNSPLENSITCLYADFQNKIWIGTLNSGMSAMRTDNRSFTHYTNLGKFENNSVFGINKDLDGSIIAGTIGGGLIIFDSNVSTYTSFTHSKTDPFSISSNSIWTVYRDKAGIIWIGTDNGLDYYKEDLMRFKTELPLPDDPLSNVIPNKNVFCFLPQEDNVWMGVLGTGVVVKEPTGGIKQVYSTANGLADNSVFCLIKDRNGIVWAGTYGGLTSINPQSGVVRSYKIADGLTNSNIRSLAEDENGNIYIGTYGGGLCVLNRQTDKISSIRKEDNKGLSNNIITALKYDGNGNLFIGTYGGGLCLLNISANSITAFESKPGSNTTISSNYINSIYSFSNQQLLVGTYSGGINIFNYATKSFTALTETNGIPNNNVTNIISDVEKNIWFTTGNQICKMKLAPSDSILTMRIYDEQDGVFNRFNPGAFTQTADGKIYFGGISGINRFLPSAIRDNPYIPPVVITKFYLFEKPYFMDTIIMSKNIIELTYNQNFFSFEYAALNYILPEKNQYAYMLEGLEKSWTYCGSKRDRQYTDLDPGTYKFRVKACNNDGIWNQDGTYIIIIIKPPFWKTWWFYILSGLTFVGLTITYIRWRTRTLMKQYEILEQKVQERTAELREEKEKSEQKSLEIERALKELKDTQSQLIHAEKMASLGQLTAGIAHEIQNPLNFVNNFSELSQDLIDELNATEDKEEWKSISHDIKTNLEKINEHGKRAERIVKSMLMHSRSQTAEKVLTDINKLAEDVMNLAYTSLRANDSNFGCKNMIELDASLPKLSVVQQDISRVLLNIFNNAFYAVNQLRKKSDKTYHPEVRLRTWKAANKVYISISDNGGGIPDDIVDKIFQPFFTTKPTGEGTGLGLSLSYDIITKGHYGMLSVNVHKGSGSEFVIELPQL